MTSSTSGRRGSYLASAAVALLVLTGCANHASAEAEAMVAPSISAAPAPSSSAPEKPATAPTPAATGNALPVMPESAPVSLTIPSIGAQSELLSLGLHDDGSLEVPPGDPGAPAGWYQQSPTPGERGPAILLGHVNATDGGPGVFANLRELRPGDSVQITREDGTTAIFIVEYGEQYPKSDFPTQTVYGNTAGSELRLITCDGYDPATGEFDANYVVYAKLATK